MSVLLGALTFVMTLAVVGASVGVSVAVMEWVLMEPRHRRMAARSVLAPLSGWLTRRRAWPRKVRRPATSE